MYYVPALLFIIVMPLISVYDASVLMYTCVYTHEYDDILVYA